MHWLCSCYTKMIEGEVSLQDFFVVVQFFITEKCSLLLGSRQQLYLHFRQLYVHATATFSSGLLPPLGINMMSLLLKLMCLGPTGQMREVWMIDVEQGVRERREKCHKGQGGTGMVGKTKRRRVARKSQELRRKQHILTDCG